MRDTPRIAGGKVPVVLHLLAPNHRPVQMTTDLSGFWQRSIRKCAVSCAGAIRNTPGPKIRCEAAEVK
jgi:HrpA-like RNA helicase